MLMIVLYRKISITTNSIQFFSTNINFFNKKTRNIAINHIPRNLFNIIGYTSDTLRSKPHIA